MSVSMRTFLLPMLVFFSHVAFSQQELTIKHGRAYVSVANAESRRVLNFMKRAQVTRTREDILEKVRVMQGILDCSYNVIHYRDGSTWTNHSISCGFYVDRHGALYSSSTAKLLESQSVDTMDVGLHRAESVDGHSKLLYDFLKVKETEYPDFADVGGTMKVGQHITCWRVLNYNAEGRSTGNRSFCQFRVDKSGIPFEKASRDYDVFPGVSDLTAANQEPVYF